MNAPSSMSQEAAGQKQRIRELLQERQAILLAHNYQPPHILEVADLCGDSLELSRQAAKTKAKVIVFCGVHFMAETASILSPEKTVLLPRLDAGCAMADMIRAEDLARRKKELPHCAVVTYVNSPASVKALSDVCCTSANAVQVAEGFVDQEILMVPDRNLAAYTASQTGKTIYAWRGFCPVHDKLKAQDVLLARQSHPGAMFLAHPECRPEVLALADAVLSTSGMLAHPASARQSSFIVGTETGLLYSLKKKYPDKQFFPASEKMVCPDMKRIQLSDIIRCLETLSPEVRVPEDIQKPALRAVLRMIADNG